MQSSPVQNLKGPWNVGDMVETMINMKMWMRWKAMMMKRKRVRVRIIVEAN